MQKFEKSPQYILYAWQLIQDKVPDWEVVFVGTGSDLDMMKNIAKSLNLNRIRFEGAQDNPLNYYKEASIFAMTSSNEGFPMVLLEAMSQYCVPIIFNSYAAATDIITHNYDGILCPPHNIKKFSIELYKLIKNISKRKELAFNAATKAYKFNVQTIGQKWDELLETCVNNYYQENY